MQNVKYDENSFLKNVEDVANDDSVLFYCINWIAVLHRYSPIAHILKVLELNPNKKIFLYVDSQSANNTGYNFQLIKDKYPNNFNFTIFDQTYSGDEMINLYFLKNMKNDITTNNLENSNKKIYLSDFQLNTFLQYDYPYGQAMSNFIYDTYYYLSKNFKEINLIPDGTATPLSITNKLYTFYKNNDLLNFDRINNKFNKSIDLQTKLNSFNENQFKNWMNDKSDNYLLYLCSLLSSSVNNTSNLPKINYYYPNTNMIKDVNSLTSKQLDKNIEFNEYFSPFNISGLNIIDFISSLSPSGINLFREVINAKDVDSEYNSQFINHTNLIYSGSLLLNDSIVKDESEKIIDLFVTNENSTNPNADLQLWFKGHPRETDDYQEKLINKVNELAPNKNYGSKLKFLDNSVPFEFLTISNLFKNDPTQNKYVRIYTTYSTIFFTLEASSKKDLIAGLYLNNTQTNDIKYTYGDIDKSICFKDKTIINI